MQIKKKVTGGDRPLGTECRGKFPKVSWWAASQPSDATILNQVLCGVEFYEEAARPVGLVGPNGVMDSH